LLFVLSLSFTLFLVNMFFEQRHQETAKEWHEQQKAKKIQKRQDLEKEIAERTAKLKELPPIVELYSDSQNRQSLGYGIKFQDTILTLSWEKSLPDKIYTRGESFQIAYSPGNSDEPALYEKHPEAAIKIGNLPHFGHYELQIVSPSKPPQITLGEYTDGHFSVPVLELQKLVKELGEKLPPDSYKEIPHNALVLMKSAEGYLPVAFYQQSTKSLIYLEQISGLRKEIVKPEKIIGETKTSEEKFYVLENSYQQLVFSNYGGALAEINLPFQTSENQKSVVKEIDFDRKIAQDHPHNAIFPENSYYTPGQSHAGPFVENTKGKFGGYHPLIRRGLIQSDEKQSIQILPEYYALNIVSEYPEMAQLVYEVTNFTQNSITFEAIQRNRRIAKIFTIDKEKEAPYCLNLTIKIEGDSRGLWLTSGVPEVEWISNGPASALKYRITRNNNSEVVSIDLPKDAASFSSIYPDWICNSNGFLGLIADPLTEIDPGFKAQNISGTIVPSRLVLVDEEYELFKAQDLPGYTLLLPLNSKGGTMNFRIFAGPFASSVLKTVDQTFSDPATGYNPDYIASQSFHGWFSFISAPFAKFLLILMQFFHSLTGSWGFSIILLTVALRLMLYPLNAWSAKSMLRMQHIAPEIQRIQEKYKKDPKKAQLEIMNLYRDKGVNPISGCFPLLIQMPFLVGMFDLLKSTFELRGASFIPGWIDNLAAPDVLFSWNAPIFFIGTQFHLLPILLGAVMFLQQRLMSPAPKDPSLMTEQQRQQKAMGTMMTVVFSIMFYHFPSGLNIYWLSSMLLGILQQWWTAKRFKLAVVSKKMAKGNR
ncbi:MAG TPA: membrane protein insertase YidC, partial [Waddliaceae bacterium]